MARPRKAAEAKAVSVTVRAPALEILDAAIDRRAVPALAAIDEPGELSPHERNAARRELLSSLIVERLGIGARLRTSVNLLAPAIGNAAELREAAAWIRETEAALNESAPPAIRAALAANRAMIEAVAEANAPDDDDG